MKNLSLPQRKNKIFHSLSDFTLLEKIGKGAFSNVFLVESKSGTKYAMKHIDLAQTHKLDLKNIRGEIEIHQTLNHPNLVKFYDYFVENTDLFMILEYCNQGNLFKRLYSTSNSFDKKKIPLIIS